MGWQIADCRQQHTYGHNQHASEPNCHPLFEIDQIALRGKLGAGGSLDERRRECSRLFRREATGIQAIGKLQSVKRHCGHALK